jgi:O-antigen/teichoic acid export membrane protein
MQNLTRRQRFAANSFAGLASKGASFLVTIALFPLLLRHLGKGDFAIWIAVVSIVQVLAWADFGLGNSLVTTLSRLPTEDAQGIRAAVSSGYTLIFGAAVFMAALLLLLSQFDSLQKLLGFGNRPDRVVLIGCVAFLLWLPSSLIGRIQTGLRMGWMSNVAQAAAALTTGVLSVIAVHLDWQLTALVAIACMTPVVINAANTAIFFLRHPETRPSTAAISPDLLNQLLRLGALFFCLQLGTVVLTGIDSMVALSQAGASEAVDYSAVARIFGALGSVTAIVVSPLWPEYGKAHAGNDLRWIRRTYIRSIKTVSAFTLVSGAVVVAISPYLFSVWPGGDVRPPMTLVMLAAVWLFIDSLGQCTAMLLNGMAIVRYQVFVTVAFVLVCLPLKVGMAANFGAEGVYASTIIAYVATIALPYAIILPRLFAKRLAT